MDPLKFAEGTKARRVLESVRSSSAEASLTVPTSCQVAPLSVLYLSEPFAVLTAVMAMPWSAEVSTSAIPLTSEETRVLLDAEPLVGEDVSSLMAVSTGD